MITEKLEESLILMKADLGLKFSDISSFAKNIAQTSTPSHKFSADFVKNIKKWQDWDSKVYEYFSKQLDRKIENFGKERMSKEILELRNLNQGGIRKDIQIWLYHSNTLGSMML